MADDSTQRSESPGKHTYPWDERRKGLTTAEKVCMQVRPRPSPACQEKIMAGIEEASPSAHGHALGRKRKSERPLKVFRMAEEPSPLEQQEETCTDILNRILPLPLSDIVPSTHRLSQSGKLQKSPSKSSQRAESRSGMLTREGSKQLQREFDRTPTRERMGGSGGFAAPPKTPTQRAPPTPSAQPALGAQASMASELSRTVDLARTADVAKGGEDVEKPHLGGLLKRRVVDFDPAGDPETVNVVRLVQGASAARIERQVGGKIVFVHQDAEDAGSMKVQAALPASQQSSLEKGGHPLHVFRRKMLEKHGSVQSAFNCMNVEATRRLDMREWCDILSKSKFCSMMEARVIYELLDADHDGNLTLPELQVGIEAVAPVTSVDQLRKRLICLGIPSMIAAISIMNGPGEDMTSQPITLPEFAVCLKRVWVLQDMEHRGLYDALRDPLATDPATYNRSVSLSDLAAALAAISPCLLTEEVRAHLARKWGSIQSAYDNLEDKWLESCDSFVHDAKEWHGLDEREAARLFNFTDIDGSGNLDRHELTGVLELSRPSLVMEECRKKVQQSHRCIEASLRDAVTREADDELNDELKFLMHELIEILEPLDMDKKEKQRLASFIGATDTRGITLCEFFKGIRLLTPSCVLEGLRLKLLLVHRSVTDAFKGIRNRRAPIGRQEFLKLLKDQGVSLWDGSGPEEDGDEETMDCLWEVLDIRSTGYITVTEFLAAIRSSEIGTRKKLPRGECESHSEKMVRDNLSGASNTIAELKRGLRTMSRDIAPASEAVLALPKQSRNMPMPRSASVPNRMNKGDRSSSAPQLPPALGAARPSSSSSNSTWAEELKVVWDKKTLGGVCHAFGTPLDQERKRKTLESLHSYVDVQQRVLKDQEVALVSRFRKAALEREVNSLKRTIMPALQLRYQAGLLV